MSDKKENTGGIKIVVTNRKARYDFQLGDRFEAGLSLTGPEVKSLRAGKANLRDSFCAFTNGEIFLRNCHISPYNEASYFNADPLRPRKLLLHKREILRLSKEIQLKGSTIVPLKIYFKNRIAKVEIAVAKGKKQYDKRADIAERDTKRRLKRIKDDYK